MNKVFDITRIASKKDQNFALFTGFDVNSKYVVCGCSDGSLLFYDSRTHELVGTCFPQEFRTKEDKSIQIVRLHPVNANYIFLCSGSDLLVVKHSVGHRHWNSNKYMDADIAINLGSSVVDMRAVIRKEKTVVLTGTQSGSITLLQMEMENTITKTATLVSKRAIYLFESPIVQIDYQDDILFCSSTKRASLLHLSAYESGDPYVFDIGKKARDGLFGGCFSRDNESQLVVFSARPGNRLWNVSPKEGNVMKTSIFRDSLGNKPPSYFPSHNSLENFSRLKQPLNYNFGKILDINQPDEGINFLISWGSDVFYLLEAFSASVLEWHLDLPGVAHATCIDNAVYTLTKGPNEDGEVETTIQRLDIVPIEKCILKSLTSANTGEEVSKLISLAARYDVRDIETLNHLDEATLQVGRKNIPAPILQGLKGRMKKAREEFKRVEKTEKLSKSATVADLEFEKGELKKEAVDTPLDGKNLGITEKPSESEIKEEKPQLDRQADEVTAETIVISKRRRQRKVDIEQPDGPLNDENPTIPLISVIPKHIFVDSEELLISKEATVEEGNSTNIESVTFAEGVLPSSQDTHQDNSQDSSKHLHGILSSSISSFSSSIGNLTNKMKIGLLAERSESNEVSTPMTIADVQDGDSNEGVFQLDEESVGGSSPLETEEDVIMQNENTHEEERNSEGSTLVVNSHEMLSVVQVKWPEESMTRTIKSILSTDDPEKLDLLRRWEEGFELVLEKPDASSPKKSKQDVSDSHREVFKACFSSKIEISKPQKESLENTGILLQAQKHKTSWDDGDCLDFVIFFGYIFDDDDMLLIANQNQWKACIDFFLSKHLYNDDLLNEPLELVDILQKSRSLPMILHFLPKLIEKVPDNILNFSVESYPLIQPWNVYGGGDGFVCRYLESMIKRHPRLKNDCSIVSKLVEISLSYYRPDGYEASIAQVGRGAHELKWRKETTMLEIISNPSDYSYAPSRLLELCSKYGYVRGYIILCRRLTSDGSEDLSNNAIDVAIRCDDLDSLTELMDDNLTLKNWIFLLRKFLGSQREQAIMEPGAGDSRPQEITENTIVSEMFVRLDSEEVLQIMMNLRDSTSLAGSGIYVRIVESFHRELERAEIARHILRRVGEYLLAKPFGGVPPNFSSLLETELEIEIEGNSPLFEALSSVHMETFLNSNFDTHTRMFYEESCGHWGVRSEIDDALCPMCELPLGEAIGANVVIFYCGHAYHQECLPEEACVICYRERMKEMSLADIVGVKREDRAKI